MKSRLASGAGDWLSIHPDGGTYHTSFLAVQRERIRNSLGASAVAHAVALAVILLVVRSAPVTEEVLQIERTSYNLIWIPEAGPGGGGGGGGDESLEMPSLVEVAGEDDLNVPVELPEPEEVEAPPELISEPETQLLESRSVRLSAVPMAAAQQTRSGVFEGLMARTLNSAGSGSGGGAGEGTGGGIGPGQGDGLGPGQGGGTGGGVYRPRQWRHDPAGAP